MNTFCGSIVARHCRRGGQGYKTARRRRCPESRERAEKKSIIYRIRGYFEQPHLDGHQWPGGRVLTHEFRTCVSARTRINGHGRRTGIGHHHLTTAQQPSLAPGRTCSGEEERFSARNYSIIIPGAVFLRDHGPGYESANRRRS